MIRIARALICFAMLNLSLSVALSVPAEVRAAKSTPVMMDASAGFHASLVRRFRARRRVERARAMPAVLSGAPEAVALQLSYSLPHLAEAPPFLASAPPDHPPA